MSDDARRERVATYAKWGLGLLAAIVISPVIFLAVKGLVGLAAALVIGLALVNFAPYVAMKFANWKVKAIKAEARENPIETRQNLALQQRERLRLAEAELTAFNTEVRNFRDEVTELSKTQPGDAVVFQDQLRQLEALQELKQQRLRAAHQAAEEFEAATARASRKWKVAQSAIRMNKLAGQSSTDAMNKLLAEESLDSVQTAMNRAFAEMDTTMALHKLPLPAEAPALHVGQTNHVEIPR